MSHPNNQVIARLADRHVLQVIPSVSYAHGGPSHAIRLTEHALTNTAWRSVTATTDDDGPGRYLRCALNQPVIDDLVTRLYFHKGTEFYKAAWSFAPWVMQSVKQFDAVHIHALFSFTSIVAAWAARRAGVPYILCPHGAMATYGITQRRPWLKRQSLRWLEGPLLRDAAAVHFTSLDEQHEAARSGIRMRSVVIPLGVQAPAAANDALVRARFGALGSEPYFLTIARIDPVKNIEGLLCAFAMFHAQMPGTKLLIAGDGSPDYVASLVALARLQGLADHVVWAGHIEGSLKHSALAGATLFVLPSFSESFGLAAAEALMAGLPCVLGQGVAISQDVVNAGAGLAVAPDAASVATGLMRLAADAPERDRMAVRAAALARDKYSAKAMGANLVALYEDILGRRETLASNVSRIRK